MAVLFVAMAVALVGMVGVAVEYGRILYYRMRLDAALDAAALAAIQQIKSSSEGGSSSADAISAATNLATGVFESNLDSKKTLLDASFSVAFSHSGATWTAAASYTAQVPSNFPSFADYYPLSKTTTSAATVISLSSYYLVLDVSGSMGLPSTSAGQVKLMAINPDGLDSHPTGCVFACHFPGNSGYDLTRNGGDPSNPSVSYCPQPDTLACIQLRVDAVANAVQQLVSTAQSAAIRPNQFAIGLFPFIEFVTNYVPLTTDLESVSSRATDLTSLLDTGSNSHLGSGGTHFENVLPDMFYNVLEDWHDGRQKFLFLVTDGMQNSQVYRGAFYKFFGPTMLDETLCKPFKAHGITVAVLYVPYLPIPNPLSNSSQENLANATIPVLPQHLQNCASPGYFFTADSPADIANAMQTMFRQTIQSPHLTR